MRTTKPGERVDGYLFVEELADFLADGVDQLDLAAGEADEEAERLAAAFTGRQPVDVVARRWRALVEPFVDRLLRLIDTPRCSCWFLFRFFSKENVDERVQKRHQIQS